MPGLLSDVFEDFQRQVFIGIVFLHLLEDGEQGARSVFAGGDGLIRIFLVPEGRLRPG